MLEGPRPAKVNELPEIVKLVSWIFGFEKYGVTVDKVLPHLFCENNVENLRVILCNGRIVSHVGIWEGALYFHGIQLKVGLIGCVCTHPDYRMRGYASMLVEDAFAKLRRDNTDLIMVSGARMLYSRVGCVESGILYDYRIPANRAKLLADCLDGVEVEEYMEDRILDLVEIYQKEPIRFRRSYEEFKLLVDRVSACGTKFKDYASILISYRMGKPIAYIALFKGWPGWLSSDLAVIVEYAGSRMAILRMLYDAMRVLKVNYIRLMAPYGDWDLITLLECYGLKSEASYAPASFAIPDPVKFIDKIKPYIEERIGIETGFKAASYDDHIELYALNESVKFKDSRMLIAILFGRPSFIQNRNDNITVDMESIPRIFRRVFPIPSISYGLNYV